jgi:hypothetical protein
MNTGNTTIRFDKTTDKTVTVYTEITVQNDGISDTWDLYVNGEFIFCDTHKETVTNAARRLAKVL